MSDETGTVLGFPHGFRGDGNGPVDPPCDVEPRDYPNEGYRLQHTQLPEPKDPINPTHYRQGNVEAIDIIEHIVASYRDPLQAGLVWQVLKYLIRAPHKGHLETDIHKASWYMERLVGKVSG